MTTPHPTTLPYRKNVGVMAINRDGLVWVGQRIDVKGLAQGWWQMPQGGLDEGEEPAAAALRELAEETGMRTASIIAASQHWHDYDLPPALMGKALGGRYRGQSQKWFLLRFLGDDGEINLTPEGHDQEFDAWRWAALDELVPLIVPFKRAVYEKVIAEFRPLVTPLR